MSSEAPTNLSQSPMLSDDLDAEDLLAQRKKIEEAFKSKFVRTVTVMFTDLKGSTSITEEQGDLATRELLKTHNDMLFPLIENHHGKLVKTMGDGTMSYFEHAQDAARTALAFQTSVSEYNRLNKPKVPIQVRIGINTGEGIVEKDDVYGDVVNVASRFESIADAGEVYLSKSSYDALDDPHEFYCRMIRMAHLKGKKEDVEVYKAFWSDEEIEEDQAIVAGAQQKGKKAGTRGAHSYFRIAIWLLLLVGAVYGVMQFTLLTEGNSQNVKTRSTIHHLE